MNPLNTHYLWHISEGHLPVLALKLRNPSRVPFSAVLPKGFDDRVKASGVAKAWNDWLAHLHSPDKNVLVLPVEGEMSRSGYWNYGNEFFIRQLNAAAQDSDFKGAVLRINTPGGTCDSTPAFAEAVANFRKVKPIVTQTGYCCSAGVYVASQCDEIIVEDQAATIIGSIGTLLIYENYKKYLEQQGIEMEIMRASASKDKARVNWIEELSEEARAGLQKMLDACQKEFAGAVKRGRAGKITTEEIFTGKTYNATDAISLGLADAKGDLNFAVKRVLKLAA
jgi:signal peptide peptidase SppA